MNRFTSCCCPCICRRAGSTIRPSFLAAGAISARHAGTATSSASSSLPSSLRAPFSSSSTSTYPRRATPFKPAQEEPDSAIPSSSSSPQQPWYLLPESPASSNSTSSSSSESPPPPSSLPTYLHPLWHHLYSSPFLAQDSINFINARAADLNIPDSDADASVQSWTDWVAVASLRNGRERGIRGACDGVKGAVSTSYINRDARQYNKG